MEAASIFRQDQTAVAGGMFLPVRPMPRMERWNVTNGMVSDPPRLRADAQRNRNRILHIAMQHFALRGIGASLEDIAKAAGVGPGTLYRHFPTREALLAAALQDRQAELLARAEEARRIADPDGALRGWLEALQDYLHTFNGLPAPVLAALEEQASPLAVSCQNLIAITGEFLVRAQEQGHARGSVTANDLFLGALGMAWVSDQVEAYGATREALETIFAYGYLDVGSHSPSGPRKRRSASAGSVPPRARRGSP
jgi:AcrR family transcriptional regulator